MSIAQTPIAQDWAWSDQFIPEIRKIVGPHLLETASLEIDRNKATDLVVLKAKNLMIACRVRRPVSRPEYARQFTMRSKRKSGVKTEYEKIVEGWGDWFFYGIESQTEKGKLNHWCLIDLNAFRANLIKNPSRIRTGEQLNVSDGTAFRWFDLTSFTPSPPLLVASNHPALGEKSNVSICKI